MTTTRSTTGRARSQQLARIVLGGFMTFAGIAHLTVARAEFLAQVPAWMPVNHNLVVLGSGAVEIALGLALLTLPQYRRVVGVALAVFYVLIFPGNIAQYVEGVDAFGLDTDGKRLIRLFFQPPLILAALWAAGIPRATPSAPRTPQPE